MRRHNSQNFAQSICNSKLNLLVKFYKKWIPRADFIEKKNLTVILAYLSLIFAFALSHR